MIRRLLPDITGSLFLGMCICLIGCNRPSESIPPEIRTAEQRKEQARAIIEKALAAHGGKAQIERLRLAQVTYKIRGSFPSLPAFKNLDVTIKETYQLPDRIKKEIQGHADGKEIELAWSAEAEMHWYWQRGIQTQIINKPTDVEGQYRPFEMLEDLAHHHLFEWMVIDSPPDARPEAIAIRCKAEEEDQGRIYYFDRNTGLLIGNKARQFLPIVEREAWMESRLSNYKEIDGLKVYHTMLGHQDGEKTTEITINEVRLLDKIDDQVFAPPER